MDNTPPQPTQQQQTSPAPPPQGGKKKLIIAIVVVVIILLTGAGLGYYFFLSDSSRGDSASTEDILMATVGDEEIYQSEVVSAAQQQYEPDAIDAAIINRFLGILVERAILDIEAENLGISVSDQEIVAQAGSGATESEKEDTKYSILKEKIISSQTRSISANVIGFWIPSFDYPQLPEYATQRTQVSVALQDLFVRLQNDESPLEVTEYASQTYPDLPKLSLNGYIYNNTQDTSLMQSPQTFVIGELDPDSTSSDPDLYAALENVEQGEVVLALRTDGSGGSVAKVENITTDGYGTYDEFLKAKTEELVTVHFQP